MTMADQGEGPLFIWGKNTKKIADGRKGNRAGNVQDLLLFYALNTKPDVPTIFLKVTQIVLTKITTETVTWFSVLTSAYQLDFLILFHHHYKAWLIHLTKHNNKQIIK